VRHARGKEASSMTEQQIRDWAYDEADLGDSPLYEIDGDLELHHVEWLELLLALSNDEACPRRQTILYIVEDFARWCARRPRRYPEEEAWTRAAAQALGAHHRDVHELGAYVERLLRYRQASAESSHLKHPVSESLAREIAFDLLIGPLLVKRYEAWVRPSLVHLQRHPRLPAVWFATHATDAHRSHLYIHRWRGHFCFASRELSDEQVIEMLGS
jgi:hypothetical protein